MQIDQTGRFDKVVKRLKANQKAALDQAVKALCADPLLGEPKIGDLAGVRVYKFRMVGQLALLGYQYDEVGQRIILLALGSHENFYRDLK